VRRPNLGQKNLYIVHQIKKVCTKCNNIVITKKIQDVTLGVRYLYEIVFL